MTLDDDILHLVGVIDYALDWDETEESDRGLEFQKAEGVKLLECQTISALEAVLVEQVERQMEGIYYPERIADVYMEVTALT
mmetsp:Transcript_19325/g.29118  ORF Transcript_19325/g.29118 Transcript_19325/m.29118 type:complete len:82 (+) Transcript_19325:172-417(+)|eukprot:CAMPEP_0178905016 /NCGR_PEP_ID=MMETSP0786-20121207/6021_1 /TAXON_ID=186022 /ORGANISM="Thalassionema frauenfeldii, Strain CCMP 1798" /LENGTH=81 /DNA_ID=CAMNT_0020576537 /DNA_START=149 /DNA_END=394 /DNA_ORIENTATION=-